MPETTTHTVYALDRVGQILASGCEISVQWHNGGTPTQMFYQSVNPGNIPTLTFNYSAPAGTSCWMRLARQGVNIDSVPFSAGPSTPTFYLEPGLHGRNYAWVLTD